MIGCDGAWSKIRPVVSETRPRFAGKSWVLLRTQYLNSHTHVHPKRKSRGPPSAPGQKELVPAPCFLISGHKPKPRTGGPGRPRIQRWRRRTEHFEGSGQLRIAPYLTCKPLRFAFARDQFKSLQKTGPKPPHVFGHSPVFHCNLQFSAIRGVVNLNGGCSSSRLQKIYVK